MDEFSGARGFLYIPVAIARDPELQQKPKTILLMGELVSMLNVTGQFYMSNKELAKRLGCQTRSIQNYLTYLEQRHYIQRTLVFADESHKQVKGRLVSAGPALKAAFKHGWDDENEDPSRIWMHEGHASECTRVVHAIAPKENSLRDHSNRKDILSGKPDYTSKPPKKKSNDNFSEQVVNTTNKVIDHLNHKAGTKYRPTSKATRRLVRARLNEGWKLDDFYKVINNKTADWKNDRQMAKYLRPETLFGTKFESYLNESAASGDDDYPTFEEMAKETEKRMAKYADEDLPF
jgi:uncharacterized phage protein (TIGR02220 family)